MKADKIIRNAKIYTADKNNTQVTARSSWASRLTRALSRPARTRIFWYLTKTCSLQRKRASATTSRVRCISAVRK